MNNFGKTTSIILLSHTDNCRRDKFLSNFESVGAVTTYFNTGKKYKVFNFAVKKH